LNAIQSEIASAMASDFLEKQLVGRVQREPLFGDT